MTQSSVLFWEWRAPVPTSKRSLHVPQQEELIPLQLPIHLSAPLVQIVQHLVMLPISTSLILQLPLAGNPLIKINFHSVVGPLGPATELGVVSLVERPPLFIVAVCFLFLGCEEVIK